MVVESVVDFQTGAWIILNAINVLMMQTGFGLLETGSVSTKHSKSVLMKNIMDTCFGALVWYLCGFGFMTGNGSVIAGEGAAFATDDVDNFSLLFSSYAFAVTATTIVSGGVVGRILLQYYIGVSVLLNGIVYPVVAHSVWNSNGFLYGKYIDYAGGVVVHGLGGTVAFVGAWLCGPRHNRFSNFQNTGKNGNRFGIRIESGVVEIPPSDPSKQWLGTLILYCSWFSFNAMSAQNNMELSMRACITTLLASSSAACTSLLWTRYSLGYYDLSYILNSTLAGLVSITGCAGYVSTHASIVIGIIGVVVFLGSKYVILYKLRIDDPLESSALHGCTGIFSAVATGIFHKEKGLVAGETDLLLVQLWGTAIIVGFGFGFSLIFFSICKWHGGGTISVSVDDQILGLDFKYHDGYDIQEFGDREFLTENSKMHTVKVIQTRNILRNPTGSQNRVYPSPVSTDNSDISPKKDENMSPANN